MAKSDFKCSLCKDVISEKFFSLGTFRKYRCPQCGTICKKHIKTHLLGSPTCTKCGSKVLCYAFLNNRWKQV